MFLAKNINLQEREMNKNKSILTSDAHMSNVKFDNALAWFQSPDQLSYNHCHRFSKKADYYNWLNVNLIENGKTLYDSYLSIDFKLGYQKYMSNDSFSDVQVIQSSFNKKKHEIALNALHYLGCNINVIQHIIDTPTVSRAHLEELFLSMPDFVNHYKDDLIFHFHKSKDFLNDVNNWDFKDSMACLQGIVKSMYGYSLSNLNKNKKVEQYKFFNILGRKPCPQDELELLPGFQRELDIIEKENILKDKLEKEKLDREKYLTSLPPLKPLHYTAKGYTRDYKKFI